MWTFFVGTRFEANDFSSGIGKQTDEEAFM